MSFLIVSQRAKANSGYSLKNLEGHGRIDIIFRSILAATRPLNKDQGREIYCFLKGSRPHGWLKVLPSYISEGDDEISLAAKVQRDWQDLFTIGTLKDLLNLVERPFQMLHESGGTFDAGEGTILLGAQADLSEEDLEIFRVDKIISLGPRSLLASHAIIYTRQLKENM